MKYVLQGYNKQNIVTWLGCYILLLSSLQKERKRTQGGGESI
jgi:hypothetical protein